MYIGLISKPKKPTNTLYFLNLPLYPELDPCDEEPCQNGGICNSHNQDFQCVCLEGYLGFLCDIGDVPDIIVIVPAADFWIVGTQFFMV